MPKLWAVGHRRGHVTSSDYVTDRFDSRLLGLLVAVTGIVATVPYIALQMFGIEVVLGQMGVPVVGALVIAFLVLAVFTYVSGLRAPALIAIAKDILIWTAVLVAIVYIPTRLGGYGAIFSHVPHAKLVLTRPAYVPFTTLAVGSALALFLYPHALMSVLAWMPQGVLALIAALLVGWSVRWGLIAGWAVGIGLGTLMLAQEKFAVTTFPLAGPNWQVYIALAAFIANLLVAVAGSLVARLVGLRSRTRLSEADFDAGSRPTVHA